MRHSIILRFVVIFAVALVVFQLAVTFAGSQGEGSASAEGEDPVSLTLWYTDEKLNSYLVEAASEFGEAHGAEVTLQLVSAVDYVEHINTMSISDTGCPDLFIISSELLEKARLAGLTVENDSFKARELSRDFPQKALDAATCGGKLVAYPFYFETCFLLYNKYYTEEAPSTIDDILEYAENYEATDVTAKVENIFKWNVKDIFYNFFFIANYVNLGGDTGDDASQVQLMADEVTECLEYYQSLNAYFAIDSDEVTTDGVLQEFIDGKTVFTIAKTDAIAAIDAAIADGSAEALDIVLPEEEEEAEEGSEDGTGEEESAGEEAEDGSEDEASEEETEDLQPEYFYGIAEVPDLTDELKTKGLSVTDSVVVNAYSGQRELAKEFARYITYDKADDLYVMANKMPVKMGVEYDNPEMDILFSQYENSMEVTKLTDLSDYWLQMELAFANIWDGSDAREEIGAVAENLMSGLTAAG